VTHAADNETRPRCAVYCGALTAGRLDYLRKFLENPRELGSITPSSRYLTHAVLGRIDFERARRIVELGPGTGVFTREALRRMAPEAELLALDTNADFVAKLQRELQDRRLTVIRAPAQRIGEEVAAHGWDLVDAVISGIPYSLLPRKITAGIIHGSWQVLRVGGRFVAYQYSPYLRPFLRARFGDCRLGLVVRNVPPAVVFLSEKRSPTERAG
jgi:phospholipid N-methyltransferase